MAKNSGKTFESDNAIGYRHQILGADENGECPYLERWVLGVGPGKFWKRAKKEGPASWFSIRLHHFFRSDEDHLHDHPFWFLTLCLAGSYEDWVNCPACEGVGAHVGGWDGQHVAIRCQRCKGKRYVVGTQMTPGTIRYRPADHCHRVVTTGCWTLVLCGPKIQDWGFFAPEGWLRQREYFRRYQAGHSACE